MLTPQRFRGMMDPSPDTETTTMQTQTDPRIDTLAAQMGRPVAEVAGFVDALRIYTSKGMTREQAVAAHLSNLSTLLNTYSEGAFRSESRHSEAASALTRQCADAVWAEVSA